MNAIVELSEFLTKNKLKQIEIIGEENNNKKSSKSKLLFSLIQSGKIQTDQQAFDYLFSENNSNNKAVYRKIKSDLKKKLINTCFFIDTSKNTFNDHQKAYYESYRYWAALMILQGRGATINSKIIALKLLKITTQYEFTELGINISRRLIQEYSIAGDLKQYQYYKNIYQQFKTNWEQELLAEELYRDLTINLTSSTSSSNEDFSQQATTAIQQLKPFLTDKSTYRFILIYGLIEVILYLCNYDYQRTIITCEESIKRLKKKTFLPKFGILIFYHKKIICYTQLKRFTEGENAIKLSLQYSIVGTSNWFISMQLYFVLAQRTQKYQKAYQIFNQVISENSFYRQRDNTIEVWKIYEAFLHFLMRIDKICLSENTPLKKQKFKLAKFLNDVPNYSKDKKGMNIPILVIQLLFYLQRKNYDKVIDRLEAIEKYCSRYLQKDKCTYRSNCFIKMLLQIPKAKFQKSEIIRRAYPFLEKLKKKSIAIANQAFEIEIIPYEDLWELILKELEWETQLMASAQ